MRLDSYFAPYDATAAATANDDESDADTNISDVFDTDDAEGVE
jgi:hypothetical protein